MRKKIVVTGSKGQLGKEIQRKAAEDRLNDYLFFDVDELDIADPNQIRSVIPSDTTAIVNCAAYTAVDLAEEKVEEARRTNVSGPKNLAEFSQLHSIYLIHISTDYVFDGSSSIPYTEDHATHPVSAYGKTKYEGELAIRACCEQACIVRTSWLYSSGGNNFVKTILRLSEERQTLGIVFDQIGSPTHAGDLADVLLQIAKNPTRGVECFHYSNEGVCSWYDFAREIVLLSGHACHVYPIETKDYPTKAKRPHFSVLNKRKIKDLYGLEIPHWQESLSSCIREIKEENSSISE